MITIYAGASIVVSNSLGEFGYPVGTWVVSEVHSLRPSTNAYVQLDLRDGSVLSVDMAGGLDIVEAPNVPGAALQGFVLASIVLGGLLLMKWIIRQFSKTIVE